MSASVDRRRVADDRRAGPAEVAREDDDRVAAAGRAREPHADDRRARGCGRRRASVTWTPCATSCSMPYGMVLNIDSVEVDVVLGVQRVAEVEHDLRAGRAQQLLGIGAARALGAFGRQVQDLVVVALRCARRRGRRGPGRGARVGRRAWRTRSWSLAESRSTSRASSAVAAVHTIAPRKPSLDEQRQQAAVVEVGVGQDDRVERRRVARPAARGCASSRRGRPGTCRSR